MGIKLHIFTVLAGNIPWHAIPSPALKLDLSVICYKRLLLLVAILASLNRYLLSVQRSNRFVVYQVRNNKHHGKKIDLMSGVIGGSGYTQMMLSRRVFNSKLVSTVIFGWRCTAIGKAVPLHCKSGFMVKKPIRTERPWR